MKIVKTKLNGLIEIQPRVFKDHRGYFFEIFNLEIFSKVGIETNFVQDNQSFSTKGTIRGLHFQKPPYTQGKLVRVVVGKVVDVVVDMRKESMTFGETYSVVLESDRKNMLYIPEGFAHGFSTLEDTIFEYKCTKPYNKDSEEGVVWNDRDLNINWMIDNPSISEKDRILPTLLDAFTF